MPLSIMTPSNMTQSGDGNHEPNQVTGTDRKCHQDALDTVNTVNDSQTTVELGPTTQHATLPLHHHHQSHNTPGITVEDSSIRETVLEITRGHLDTSQDHNHLALGYSYESPMQSPTSTAFGSVKSGMSVEDLEKGGVAPQLLQQEIGSHDPIKSDLTLVNQKGHIPSVYGNKEQDMTHYQTDSSPLPEKRGHKLWRRLRHSTFAVYQRLFSLVLLGNIAGFIAALVLYKDSKPFGPPLDLLATAVAANVTVAILIRQEYVVNALYDIFCWTPLWMPLAMRRVAAKFYHFGGVHSGCAISSTVWFVLYTVLMTIRFAKGDFHEIAILVITYCLLLLFVAICVFAIPRLRSASHNTFEVVHRFGGWLAVALFWVLIFLSIHAQARSTESLSIGKATAQSPAFWLLLVTTLSIILPWLRLRSVPVRAEALSSHAIRLHFSYIQRIGPVLGIRIATSPLKEWHAFATIPSPDDPSSFSVIVSDAGDFTKKQITSPASSYWVRGIPITGVLRMAVVFKRVVVVTTGSGIGPVMSLMYSSQRIMTNSRILWSTPSPLETYGQGIVDAVKGCDDQAVIWNTRVLGRPNMIALTYKLWKESGAEAVFVISNPALTKKVVYGMESRGVPAYGPIWDS